MRVKIEYLGHIKEIVGGGRIEEVEIKDDAVVEDLLTLLSEKYGEPFRKAIYEPKMADVKSNFVVTVNGYLLNQLHGVQTRLENGDCVILMPIVSGG